MGGLLGFGKVDFCDFSILEKWAFRFFFGKVDFLACF
jgi:hypothetical protein